MKKYFFVVTTLCLLMVAPAGLYGQGGLLDDNFGIHGKIITDFPVKGRDFGYAIARQPDGKLLVGGYAFSGGDFDYSMVRYWPDGTVDPSFGVNGTVFSGLRSNDYLQDIALQSDGKIVIAGYRDQNDGYYINKEIVIARYLANGTFDTTFNAEMIFDMCWLAYATSVIVQPDGKIVVGGYTKCFSNKYLLVRYLQNGDLDNSFGDNGKIETLIGAEGGYCYDAVLQPDGKILVAGNAYISITNSAFAIARYLPNGTLDASFGSAGIVLTDIQPSSDRINALALRPDGRIVAGGYSYISNQTIIALAQYHSDGSLDAGFGTNGTFISPVGELNAWILDMKLLPDGKIVASGVMNKNSGSGEISAYRFMPNGAWDTTFSPEGIGGVAGMVINEYATGLRLILLPDGRTILAGGVSSGLNSDFLMVKFDEKGDPDTDFGFDGVVITDVGTSGASAMTCAIQPDGKILVGGNMSNGNSYYALARYLPDGFMDNSFGNNGLVFSDVGYLNLEDWVLALATQPDGKILAAGYSGSANSYSVSLARFYPDGRIDSTFSQDGKVITSLSQEDDVAHSIYLLPEGKILLAGLTTNGSTQYFALVRYLPDGNLDMSFGTGGIATYTLITGGYQIMKGIAIQPDGKIVLAASYGYSSDPGVVIVRMNADGSPDNSFGVYGRVVTNFEDIIYMYSFVQQSNGKFLMAGYLVNSFWTYDIALARFLPTGVLDQSFGDGGIVITAADDIDLLMGTSCALQADGKIIAGGLAASLEEESIDFAVARYLPDGSIDMDFGVDGMVMTDFDGAWDGINAIAIQPDGKIVAVGESFRGDDRSIAIARYLPGLVIGALDFSVDDHSVLVYPNPIRSSTTLEYTLVAEDQITIRLVDAEGKAVQTFVAQAFQSAGDYRHNILIPEALPSGWYSLVISGKNGQLAIKVVK
jgi:uncharacterized delta-60 repeat protein